MKARLQHILSIPVCVIALVPVILVSGCVLAIDGNGSATLAPSSSSATPVPASLYLDPPLPGTASPDVIQPPAPQEPAARVPFVDETFGTRLVRVTDRKADISQGDASEGLRNEHSSVQAFNADDSRFLIRGTAGSWYLYNATTLLPEGRLPFDGAVEPRWDAVRPDVLYYLDGPRFMRYNITAQERIAVHDFSSQFSPHAPAHVWTNSFGGPSQDGRYWGLMAQGAMGKTFAFIIYDLAADQIVARRDITPTGGADSVTISPLGDYFLAYFEPRPDGKPGTDADPAGLMVYDKDLKNGRCLISNVSNPDIALDAQGREVLVYLDNGNNTIAMCNLATGQITGLLPANSGIYVSGRAPGMPGWALVSASNQVFAAELKQGGRMVRLATAHSLSEPQATTDRNFTRVLFASSWGRPDTAAVETYLIVLPQGWTEQM